MCGIAGTINYYAKRKVSKNLLEQMVATLEHRGPDDVGLYVKGNVGLGVRRLSVIDLEKGHQPISNKNETIWVVYNGEIYNHKELRQDLEQKGYLFKTHTDTEILVHLYEDQGKDMVHKLNGMFAFAIWDTRTRTLLLARDRAGIKPLYYYIGRDKIAFASEIKALLQDKSISQELDLQALHDYFTLLYVPGPQSMFSSIKKLPPAHMLEYIDGELSIQKYWTIPFVAEKPDRELSSKEIQQYAIDVHERLQSAVRKRMVSDVPLGAFLSGGIDSSAIVALMSQVADTQVKTFSIGFKNAGYYDERKFARKIVKQFNTQHHEFEVEPRVLEILPTLVKSFDEPFADSSAIPSYYLSAMARQHVTVCLSGTGGDELFGGYRRYLIETLFKHYQRYPKSIQGMAMNMSKMLPASRKSALKEYFLLLKRFLSCQEESSPMLRHLNMMSCFTDDAREALFSARLTEAFLEMPHPLEIHYKKTADMDDLARTLFTDFHSYLPDDLLVKEDRMTMAASLEGRLPFLDHEFVEYVAAIPSSLKVRNLTTKYIFKEAMRPTLPASIIDRRKHGFAVPIGEWFKRELKDYAHDVFQDTKTAQRGYCNADYSIKLLNEHQKGLQDNSPQLWALLMFELWCREYLD
ncbi:asparagine synthase (glutamine-hydrolyzing) [candidate division KSB3 bacterium]|uniref:asparagine synthase (glutamine-hydrolyzing) n=1 Tax=candidate division KSB3 bacterium TaxID=2044937 RepID=A0A2G6E607_9BACT|nr:MAG: asparagine synthase (glutamine-hydrolyzing) [candidate division KSB3 bacterium]PIE29906.1 MAG: asparagine synthase (glutamine-hydrolyzing) [candidate division KSB3 bacterium]